MKVGIFVSRKRKKTNEKQDSKRKADRRHKRKGEAMEQEAMGKIIKESQLAWEFNVEQEGNTVIAVLIAGGEIEARIRCAKLMSGTIHLVKMIETIRTTVVPVVPRQTGILARIRGVVR